MRRLAFAMASLGLAIILAFLAIDREGSGLVRAGLANLAVVAWTSFVLPLRGLPRLETYFQLKFWERSGRLYRGLGVPAFRWLVRRGPLAVFNRALPAAWHTGDAERIEHETRAAEAAHLIAFGIILAMALVALLRGDPARAAWLAAFDVPMNLYPVLLQRDHRVRLAELVRRGDLQHAAGAAPRAGSESPPIRCA